MFEKSEISRTKARFAYLVDESIRLSVFTDDVNADDATLKEFEAELLCIGIRLSAPITYKGWRSGPSVNGILFILQEEKYIVSKFRLGYWEQAIIGAPNARKKVKIPDQHTLVL